MEVKLNNKQFVERMVFVHLPVMEISVQLSPTLVRQLRLTAMPVVCVFLAPAMLTALPMMGLQTLVPETLFVTSNPKFVWILSPVVLLPQLLRTMLVAKQRFLEVTTTTVWRMVHVCPVRATINVSLLTEEGFPSSLDVMAPPKPVFLVKLIPIVPPVLPTAMLMVSVMIVVYSMRPMVVQL